MNESNFLPMSEAIEQSDAVPSHRELLYALAYSVGRSDQSQGSAGSAD